MAPAQSLRSKSGSLAILAAMRLASSFRQQLRRCWLPCILVIDMRERLPNAVLDDEAREVIFNDPWWREATR